MKFANILSLVLILLSSSVMSPYTHAELVGAWLFDEGRGETIKDASGNGHDGEIVGMDVGKVKWTKKGKFRSALEFIKGSNQGGWGHVFIPHHKDLNLIEFTITAWIKIPDVVEPFWVHKKMPMSQMIVSKGENCCDMNYFLFILGTGGQLGIDSAGQFSAGFVVEFPGWDQIFVEDTREVTDDKWHFVAGTYDGAWIHAYIDGDEVGKVENKAIIRDQRPKPHFAKPGCFHCNDTPLMIGAHPRLEEPEGMQGVIGFVDDVALFRAALPQEEIESVMTEGLENFLAVNPKGILAATWGKIKANR